MRATEIYNIPHQDYPTVLWEPWLRKCSLNARGRKPFSRDVAQQVHRDYAHSPKALSIGWSHCTISRPACQLFHNCSLDYNKSSPESRWFIHVSLLKHTSPRNRGSQPRSETWKSLNFDLTYSSILIFHFATRIFPVFYINHFNRFNTPYTSSFDLISTSDSFS